MIEIPIKYDIVESAICDVDNKENMYIKMPIDGFPNHDMSYDLGREISHFMIHNYFDDRFYQAPMLMKNCSSMLGYGIFSLVKEIVRKAEANEEGLSDYIKQFLDDIGGASNETEA